MNSSTILHKIHSGEQIRFDNDADLRALPDRADFLEGALAKRVRGRINKSQSLLFMPNSYVESKSYATSFGPYVINAIGILPCGAKTCVRITGIKPYLDVKVPASMNYIKLQRELRVISSTRNWNCTLSCVELFSSNEFTEEPQQYCRMEFEYQFHRTAALKELQNSYYITSSNDTVGAYMNKAMREYGWGISQWNLLTGYEVIPDSDKITTCEYEFVIPVERLKKLSDGPEFDAQCDIYDRSTLTKDQLIVASWDIETMSQTAAVPRPETTGWDIFMICVVFFRQYESQPFLRVCLSTIDMHPPKDVDILVVCARPGDTVAQRERKMLSAFAQVLGKMRPDIIQGYNSSSFDWPNVIYKIKGYGQLALLARSMDCGLFDQDDQRSKHSLSFYRNENVILQFGFHTKTHFKVNADFNLVLERRPAFAGVIDVDIMAMFLKLHSSANVRLAVGLNVFLQKNGLESKDDMPYQRMFNVVQLQRDFDGRKKPHDIACHCHRRCTACDGNYPHLEYTFATQSRTNAKSRISCCYCRNVVDQNLHDAALVAHYCIVDCIRPQQLMVKRAVLQDRRELSNLAFVPLFDAFYKADGMKVRNLFHRHCHKRSYAYSVAKSGHPVKTKYPGAYVFPPIRGLNDRRPVTGLDFAQLYPSCMMTFNISTDKLVKTQERKEELEAKGYTLCEIPAFDYKVGPYPENPKDKPDFIDATSPGGWTVWHNGCISPKDTQTVDHWDWDSVSNKAIPVMGRAPLPGENMGISGYIVKKIGDKRAPLKRLYVSLVEAQEAMKIAGTKTTMLAGVEYSHDDLQFRINTVDAKQKALKVLSNTLYGEMGSSISPIHELLVAAGITMAGQRSIKAVAQFVTELGYKIYYGDTDSLYLECPAKIFAEVDAKYAKSLREAAGNDALKLAAKREYWSDMIKITMVDMKKLSILVSQFLVKRTGTNTLNMAYEEVGMPTVFCGKKKYFMMPHVQNVNIDGDHIFVKGIETVKQNTITVAKHLGDAVMREILLIGNTRSMKQIVMEAAQRFIDEDHSPRDFASAIRYKPGNKNTRVNTFIQRMETIYSTLPENSLLKILYEPPSPGDKFEAVMVHKPEKIRPNGTRIPTSKGDSLEYLRVVEHFQNTDEKMQIDMIYYMTNIASILARFITDLPEVQNPEYDMTDPVLLADKETYKKADKALIDSAIKLIMNTIVIRGNNIVDKSTLQRFKSLYRQATSHIIRAPFIEPMRKELSVPDTIQRIVQHAKAQSKQWAQDKTERFTLYDYNSAINDFLHTKSNIQIFLDYLDRLEPRFLNELDTNMQEYLHLKDQDIALMQEDIMRVQTEIREGNPDAVYTPNEQALKIKEEMKTRSDTISNIMVYLTGLYTYRIVYNEGLKGDVNLPQCGQAAAQKRAERMTRMPVGMYNVKAVSAKPPVVFKMPSSIFRT